MTDGTNSNIRVLAAGAERALPQAVDGKRAETERAGGNWFVRRILTPLVAGIALVASHGCDSAGPENTDSDHDADVVQDVEDEGDVQEEDAPAEDAEAVDVEIEEGEDSRLDVDVEEDAEVEADVLEEDGRVETEDSDSFESGEICPTTETVTENPAAPGTIAGIGQDITEVYDVTTECDGSESRMLAESDIAFDSPVSRDTSDRAIASGAETIMFGQAARITKLRVGMAEFAFHIAGAEGTRHLGESVNDGAHVATLQVVSAGNVNLLITDMVGTEIGVADLAAGQYYILPSGRIVMVTDIRYDAFDPLNSTCNIAILEAPVLCLHTRTISFGAGVYAVSIENDVLNVLGIGLLRTSP